jgi:uncharacterized protein with FMN-binding domain
MAGLNSKTILEDSGGRASLCMAFRRSGVRIPSVHQIFQYEITRFENPQSQRESKIGLVAWPVVEAQTLSGTDCDGGLERLRTFTIAGVLGTAALAGCGGFGPATLQISAPLKNGQYTGQDITTRFGDVQVQITVSNGHITDVQAPLLPGDRARSFEISQTAGPILNNEALQAVSAKTAQVDIVSGATYTSDAYIQSLQSAIDRAHA